jgi:hypothetical protein
MRRTFVAASAILLLLSGNAFAQNQPQPPVLPGLIPATGELQGGAGACSFVTGEFHFDCIPIYIAYLIQVIFGFAGGFCLQQIIFAGYSIAMSGLTGGDKSKGISRLTWALIGLAVSVGAFLIVDFVVDTLVYGPP